MTTDSPLPAGDPGADIPDGEIPDDDKLWRIAGMSPAAIEAARAAARRAGVPLATWLTGLIHDVADREAVARDDGLAADETDP